jgi:hypothetical protein
VFLFIQSIISNPRIAVIVGIVALILYFKIIVDFLNYYLDGIILTNKEIIVFKWEWLLNYKTEHIALDSIEGISYTQNGLYDVFWNIWDISIRLNHGITIPFESIYKPKDQTQHLMSLKEQYIANSRFDFDNSTDTNDQDKFNILVETLSTMILDHVKKE